ncbi:MFS transporter [Pseudomonas sp. DWP3-1-2]|uniref:MFS transporter n=1 Tax=Pseudomonas sp. DWP3-1-2 TaxID=2804645 RepID=UPI003CF27232
MLQTPFFGRKVVAAAFVLAMFGWGIGFYGPPIFMYAVIERTGWSVQLCSAAVTVHFLAGTLVVVNLPRLYRLVGVARITVSGALLLSVGVYGWSIATQPYQLFIAAMLSGFGWVTLGAAAVNSIIAPWYVVKRPAALAMAYNGASMGGVVFSSVWVALISAMGFSHAALMVGALSVVVIGALSLWVFRYTPDQRGQFPDGSSAAAPAPSVVMPKASVRLWGNRQFMTLAAGMSLGLFAQIGLIAHLFLLLTAQLDAQQAGLAMGVATASAIVGRTLVGWLMPINANRRTVACLSYGVQLLGSVVLIGAGDYPALVWVGVALFGAGIGNATSLPPLIAQTEFAQQQTQRVVALIVAIAQGCYAFAPAVFGAVFTMTNGAQSGTRLFVLAAVLEVLAIVLFALGGKARIARAPVLDEVL